MRGTRDIFPVRGRVGRLLLCKMVVSCGCLSGRKGIVHAKGVGRGDYEALIDGILSGDVLNEMLALAL